MFKVNTKNTKMTSVNFYKHGGVVVFDRIGSWPI